MPEQDHYWSLASGYGFGALFLLPHEEWRPRLLWLGAAITVCFILMRAANLRGDAGYGHPRPWNVQSRGDGSTLLWTFLVISQLHQYPASLQYLLMTWGPAIMLLAALDSNTNPNRAEDKTTREARFLHWLTRPVLVFGRVPLFYYLLHIPLIHGGAVLLDYLRFGWSPLANSGPWFNRAIMPDGYGVSLPVVYLIWIAVLLILYLPCKWFAGVKQRRRDVWLSYF